MTVPYDREEFRKYLQSSGAVEAVSRVFLKLYELKENRPKSSVKFIQERISDSAPSLIEYEKLKEDLIAMGGILTELRNGGKLEDHHIAVIDTIGVKTDTSLPKTNVVRPITARQSQIFQGNKVKKSAGDESKIRLLDKSNPSAYETNIKNAIEDLLAQDKCNSLLKSVLQNAKKSNNDLYTKYKSTETGKTKTTFVDCICSGLDIPESMIGVYAPDVEAYDTFKDLFDPIIKEYHGFDGTTDHPTLDWGDRNNLPKIDSTKQYIVATRVRCIRNVQDYPLVPKMDKTQLGNLRNKLHEAFNNKLSSDDLKGNWHDADNIKDTKTKQDLIDNGYILEFGDKYLESVGATQFWPYGRAVYINDKKTLFVWINEEDHMRFISMEAGGEIGRIYERLQNAVRAVEDANTKFQIDKRLGFVSLCPTNLGNTIRASMMIKVPKLIKKKELENLASTHELEVRPGPASDTVEISNKKKMGITEFQTIKDLCEKINKIITAEEKV